MSKTTFRLFHIIPCNRFLLTDPPSVKCKNFTDLYGYQGAAFPCHYSRKNKTVVMTSYSRDTQLNTIIHFFIVPFIITVISSVGICVIHCNCTCKKERPKYRRPRIENIRFVFIQPIIISRDFNDLILDFLILTKTIFSWKKFLLIFGL